ncbi:TetR/AcrR family transcriptional regulator [Actinoallomurus rhizosphaericola]|uniref:TetR/AcrR family transcriptional regulator n=1 Tax=Actinoallomurus rhizosphaericola TaxID=2952536 RepID=UPI002092A491|nr:TetR family transcriptional regulator [Actinoallomurus rhizosphaericola]MCO5999117.1 TetR/AcrR family transcriptional regulator [Actinoallomurus rhizosphaericola]
MGRWEPNPRGRLAKAAIELFTTQGFDQTTGAQIAARAGMHERSFFRLFPDKREVFFHALETARQEAVAAIADAPEGTAPIDAAAAALEQRCAIIQQHPGAALIRHGLIEANVELRERDLSKHAELATGMAEALRERGTPEPTATLAADTTMAVFRRAFDRWIGDPEHQDLPTLFRDGLSELASMLVHRARPAE